MSRVAKLPIEIPAGVEVKINGQEFYAKGSKGEMNMVLHDTVSVAQEEKILSVSPKSVGDYAMAGTMRALLNNIITGVSAGFEKKLELVGVGYRAQSKGKTLNLALGFSHPVDYAVPEGITIETPSQTEIVITGTDKQRVGQVAAEIRAFRPPEPYKGKGVKYAGERILRKEAKKK